MLGVSRAVEEKISRYDRSSNYDFIDAKPRVDMYSADEPMSMMGPSLRTKLGLGIRSVLLIKHF